MQKQQRWGIDYAHKTEAFSGTAQWMRECKEVIDRIPLKGTVVDLACSMGRLISLVKELKPEARYIGVDINEEALKVARVKLPDVTFLNGIGRVPSASVDYVTCMHALPQFEFPREELRGVWYVLKPGGGVSFVLHNRYNDYLWWFPNLFNGYKSDETIFHSYSLEEVRALMKRAGFEGESIRLTGGGWVCWLLPFCKPRIIYHGRKPL